MVGGPRRRPPAPTGSASTEPGAPREVPVTTDWVFPASWRRAAMAWWVVATALAVGLVAWTHTTLPYMVELVLSAGLFTIPGLAVSRLLVRRSHPSLRGPWWTWLYGLRCFFLFGYLIAMSLIAGWLRGQPLGTATWSEARLVASVFGAVAVVAWGAVIRDTLRNGMGGRDRSEIAIDLVMALVVVSGPTLSFAASVAPSLIGPVEGFLVGLRPVAAAFGIATGVFWIAHIVLLLRDTAGLRALSVDGIDLVSVAVALAAAPLVTLGPVLAQHPRTLWLTVPFVSLAVVVPAMACGTLTVLARVSRADRRIFTWLLALLAVSGANLWAQVAMILSGFRLPVPALVLSGCANFGFFLVLPLVEQRRRIEGLGRLTPEAQLRRWDIAPAVAAAGVVALLVELLLDRRAGSGPGILTASATCALVLLGIARHYANVRETRRLHQQVEDMTAELYAQSRVDPLTGLFNRRALDERFPALAASCARAARPLSVVMVDLDDFKRFNDRHGHLAGDGVLGEIARRIRTLLRTEDLAARFGGEEICLVLPGAAPEQAAALLERLRHERSAAGAATPLDTSVAVTFSAGVARWQPGEQLADVLRRADAACYAAKAAGRDRIVIDGRGAAAS